MSQIHTVSSHPLIAHKLTLLRDKQTKPFEFRRLLREITFYLGFEVCIPTLSYIIFYSYHIYQATRGIATTSYSVTTPMGAEFEGKKVAGEVAIIPILRAGTTTNSIPHKL